MKHIYDVDGNKCNESLFSTMLLKDMFATITCEADLSLPNTYTWGEEVSGTTTTPFVSMKALYNGTPCQADCRIITYEDGSPIVNDGKVYFTMSTQAGRGSGGAIICELNLTTCEIKMTGCLISYYDGVKFSATGNAIMYNREVGKWLLLSHSTDAKGHQLIKAESISDPRFGVSTIYYSDLDYQSPGSGDEDQFIFYSDELEKWVMIYVAIRNNDANYILKVYTSDYWDHGFVFSDEINDSSTLRATGVTAVKIGGTRYILSGSSATGTNKYLAYSFPNLEYVGELNLDYGTGAQKGVWANVFPVVDGNKTKYYMLTFDRAALINGNLWSYGCLYMYCAEEANDGMEHPIKRDGLTIYTPSSETYDVTDLHFKRKWAIRNPMDFELRLSEIKLDQSVLYDQSNMYPVIGSIAVKQDATGLYLNEDGTAIIVGGEHDPFASYILSNELIQDADKRSLVIFGSNQSVKLRVSVTKDGKVYGYNGSTETLLGTMRQNSKELIICTSWNVVYLFER